MHNYIINFNFALNKNTAFLKGCNKFWTYNVHVFTIVIIHFIICNIYTYLFWYQIAGHHVVFIAGSPMRSNRHYDKKIRPVLDRIGGSLLYVYSRIDNMLSIQE